MSGAPARVVILGGGFAGLYASSYLARADLPDGALDVTLVSERNYFAFLPLLPEVVGGALAHEDVAFPLRAHARKTGFRFLRARVEAVRPERKEVVTSAATIPYDYLLIALGASPHYHGNLDIAQHALPLTSIQDALTLRHRLLATVEQAVLERDPDRRARRLFFAVAGAGPSGVEVASEIQRLLQRVLERDHGIAVPCPVALVHGGDRILDGWDESLASEGLAILRQRDVDVRLRTRVEGFSPGRVRIQPKDGPAEDLPAEALIWTAGTRPATAMLEDSGLAFTGSTLTVEPDLRVRGQDCVFAAGDAARLEDPRTGRPYPPVAPIAISQGIRVAANIENAVAGRDLESYEAYHAGRIISLGGGQALVDILGWRSRGRSAWLIYRMATLLQLVGTGNKLRALSSLLLNRLFEPPDVFD